MNSCMEVLSIILLHKLIKQANEDDIDFTTKFSLCLYGCVNLCYIFWYHLYKLTPLYSTVCQIYFSLWFCAAKFQACCSQFNEYWWKSQDHVYGDRGHMDVWQNIKPWWYGWDKTKHGKTSCMLHGTLLTVKIQPRPTAMANNAAAVIMYFIQIMLLDL